MDKIFQIPNHLCLTLLWLAVVVNLVMADSVQPDSVTDQSTVSKSLPSLQVFNELVSNFDKDGSQDVSAGDTLSYIITVSNSGNADLINVMVKDDLTGDSTICDLVTPGNACELSTSYVVQVSDLGKTIVSSGAGDSDQTEPVYEVEDVPVPSPSLSVVKTLTGNADEDGSFDVSAGDTLNYSIVATNDGTANLTNMTVKDDLTGDSTRCGLVTPGSTCELMTRYVVQASDLDTTIFNVSTADSDQTEPVNDDENVAVPSPSLSVIKILTDNNDEDGSGDVSAGDTLSYTITVTNSGKANLSDVTVEDDLTGASTRCALIPAAGSSGDTAGTCVLYTSYAVIAADVLAGELVNTGTGDSHQTKAVDDKLTITVPNPSLTTEKVLLSNADEDGSGDVSVGDTLTFRITVLNSGTANLRNVRVTDDLTSDSTVCTLVTPGDTCELLTGYVVQGSDLGMPISNIGSGDSDQTPSDTYSEEVSVPTPSLIIDVVATSVTNPDGTTSANLEVDEAGDVIIFTITATNNGTANLTYVTFNDDMTGTTDVLCADIMAPAESCQATVMYSVTQADIDYNGANPALSGLIENTSTGNSNQTSPLSDSEQVPVVQTPEISFSKTFADESVMAGSAGSSVNLVVTNTGNVTLNDVLIEDEVDPRLIVTGVSGTAGTDADSDANTQTVEWLISSLAPGQSATITVQFAVESPVPEANGNGGLSDAPTVTNEVTVIAKTPQGDSVTAVDNDNIDILVDVNLSIVKTFEPTEVPQGTLQSFTIEVSNAGPSDAVDVSVSDSVQSTLVVKGVSLTTGRGNCSASNGQEVDCTVQIPAGESVAVTVDYLTAPFLSEDPSPYGTTDGDDFYFVFHNGSVLEGSTDGGPVFLDGADITADVTIVNNQTRNDIVFDPPGPDPAYELHLSCSDPFTDGWGGPSGGPVESVDVNWQIAFFSIARYNSGSGFIKNCGNVVNPFEIPNTGTANGIDSVGFETVSIDAAVTILPGITLDQLQTKGKRVTVRLTNFVDEEKEILNVEAEWPSRNGNMKRVWLTQDGTSWVVWIGNDDPTQALLDTTAGGWNGASLLTGEGILRYDFVNNVKSTGYSITVNFADGTLMNITR